MSKPNIKIENVRAAGNAVEFEATIAGHTVPLRMPQEFVEDNIRGTDDARVQKYFADNAADIEEAARVRAYEHATRSQKPGDPPGPVPYAAFAKAPFTEIRIRE